MKIELTEAGRLKKEMQKLKPWDTADGIAPDEKIPGAYWINTPGHGYLAVPKYHRHYALARGICKYGFKGALAVYLEEDCEAPEFTQKVLGTA